MTHATIRPTDRPTKASQPVKKRETGRKREDGMRQTDGIDFVHGMTDQGKAPAAARFMSSMEGIFGAIGEMAGD